MTKYISTQILVSAGNVRGDVDAGLAASIREHGILDPLKIYRLGEDYVVQDGHRRLAGAVAAGLVEVPYEEVDAPADESKRIVAQYVINQHRKALSYLDQAKSYADLAELGWKQKEIAETLGVSEATVSLALTALRAHPTIQAALLSGKISPSAAEIVTSLPYDEQGEIADQVVHAKTVRNITDVVRTYKKAKSAGAKPVVRAEDTTLDIDPFELMAVDALEEALKNIQMADTIILTNPDLRVRGMAAVEEIAKLVARVQYALLEEVEVYEYEDA